MNIIYYHILDFLYLIFYQLRVIAPFWLGGILVGGIISAYFSDQLTNLLSRLKEHKHPHMTILLGSVIGAISPVTMHGMVPIVLLMRKKGMPQAVLASFIITSVLINPNVFFYSFALGTDIALIRLLVTIVAGYVGGALIQAFAKDKDIFKPIILEPTKKSDTQKHKVAIHVMLKTIKKTLPYLMLGILITATFEKFIPKDIFDNVFTTNENLSVIFGSALGVPLYFCGGGSIPLIMSWMNHGMSTGAVMAFVLAGPATKINNVTAVAAMAKKRYVVLYIIYMILLSILIGTITDLAF